MHTALVIIGGFLILAICLIAERRRGGPASRAVKVFLPIWGAAAALNMWMGVQAGYTVAEELPIFLLIVAVPAAVALFIGWKWR